MLAEQSKYFGLRHQLQVFISSCRLNFDGNFRLIFDIDAEEDLTKGALA
jgi:hypothetical protein